MFSGLHGDYEWDFVKGELIVSSRNRKVGPLRTFDAPGGFNNAEQAQWFAQARIDIHGEELARLEQEKLAGLAAQPPRLFRRPPLQAAKTLLSAAGLPTDDLPDDLEHFLGLGERSQPQGIVGLEIHDDVALLRSLAIIPEARGRGHGKALVAAAEQHAAELGVQRIYLLTETAREFFASLGYAEADRASAPERIQATREFSQLCPASAAFMMKPVASAVRC